MTAEARRERTGAPSHLSSCSSSSKAGVSKNARRDISSPSHSFLMVETVALLLRPLTMLFNVDWVTPLRVASRLTVISRWAHSSRIRARTAV